MPCWARSDRLRGDTGSAIPHLEEASRHRPELLPALAVMYAKQKDDRSAQNAATRARKFFAEKTEFEPKVPEYRLQWR